MLDIQKIFINYIATFLPKRMKINKSSKLVCTVQEKEKYVVHIGALKQALNHGLVLERVHRIIQIIKKHG